MISWELDPPAEERLAKLADLLAQSIADQRNIHRGKDAPVAKVADFLPPEPQDEEEAREQPDQPQPPDAMRAVGARQTGMALMPGHGAKPPGRAIEAFFGKVEGDGQG